MLAISLTFDNEEERILKTDKGGFTARRRHKDFEIGQGLSQRPAPCLPRGRARPKCNLHRDRKAKQDFPALDRGSMRGPE